VTLCILRVFAGLTTKNFQIQSLKGFFTHFQEVPMAKGKKSTSVGDGLLLWGIIALIVLGMLSTNDKKPQQSAPPAAQIATTR
jgi:hypothetical protein